MPLANWRKEKKKVLKIEMSVQAAYDDEDDERSCRTRQTER